MEFAQNDASLLIDLSFAILITLPFSWHFRTILSIQDQSVLYRYSWVCRCFSLLLTRYTESKTREDGGGGKEVDKEKRQIQEWRERERGRFSKLGSEIRFPTKMRLFSLGNLGKRWLMQDQVSVFRHWPHLTSALHLVPALSWASKCFVLFCFHLLLRSRWGDRKWAVQQGEVDLSKISQTLQFLL